MHEPLKVRVTDERQAASLARSLRRLDGLHVHCADDGCEIAVDGADSDRVILSVLDAVRDTLAGDPASSASVLLNSREYHMQGE